MWQWLRRVLSQLVGRQAAGRAAPIHWLGLALGLAIVALQSPAWATPNQAASNASTTASAGQLPPLPAKLPQGYLMEAQDRVRWIYPESASDTVADLQAALPDQWRALARTFGQELPADLDIRVAIDPSDMRRLVGGRVLPDYASGVAFPAEGLILLSLTAPESWQRPDMGALLAHELSHVALERAVGGTKVPRWFTEGVAIHQAGEQSLARIRTLWTGTLAQRLMPVEALSNAFPVRHHEVDLAYAQSADLVRYLLDGEDDAHRFRDLIAAMRRGETFEQAVQTAYHVSLGYIEREWRSQVTRRFGRWPSILAGLTGVWALGALLLLLGYVRTRRRHHRTLAQWEAEEAASEAGLSFRAVTEQMPLTEENDNPRPHRVDEVFDQLEERRREPSGVPTVEHEGRSYTLH